ncbi:MAG: fatty acid desaturase family protein, partial [Flavobacteriales bacterium]
MEAQAPQRLKPAASRVTVKQTAEGKDLILATRPFAHEVRWRSWMHLAVSLAVTVCCYLGAIASQPWWAKAAFGILTGLALVRLFILYHDHQHKSILNRSRPAAAFFWFFGLWMLSPPSIWKRSHDHHHKHNCKLYTSSIGSFPVVTVEKYRSLAPGERFAYRFIRSPFAIAFGYVFVFIIGMCLNSFISNRGRHWDSLVTLIFHAALGFATWWFLGWENLVFAFFL